MSRISTVLNENAARIDREMAEYLKREDEDLAVLCEAMRYSASSGGKRIRPTLTLEFSRMLGGSDERAIPLACAIEMIHTYSLIHDDLPCMDNDDYRRGRLTNHKMFGEANALLAGDALLTFAFGTVTASDVLSDRAKVKAVTLLSEAAGPFGMVGGQVIDLIGDKRKLEYPLLVRMQRLKTGCLIRAAAKLGVIAALDGKDAPEWEEIADRYASAIGLAFQIEDDILDDGSEDQKTTFLTYMSVEEAKKEVARLTEEALQALRPLAGSETLSELAVFLADRKK